MGLFGGNYDVADVYAVDFGSFVKIGMSVDFNKRIKCLKFEYGVEPVAYFSMTVKDACVVERLAKGYLFDAITGSAIYPTETFGAPFSYCVKSLCDAEAASNVESKQRYYDIGYYPTPVPDGVVRKLRELDGCGVDVDNMVMSAIATEVEKQFKALIN